MYTYTIRSNSKKEIIMTAQVIPFKKSDEKEPVCSFCKTPKSKAKSMIKSNINSHHICDKCIAHATERLFTNDSNLS